MKRRTLIKLILLSAFIISLSVPACTPDPVEPQKVEQPTEPPDNPPPPPPPPPGALRYSGAKTLEAIAGDVLKGFYGPQLQRLLADEVSACVNMMAASNIVSICMQPGGTRLELLESDCVHILYNDGYLVEWILGGRYGPTARLNLHDFIRSFETKNMIP